MRNQDLRDYAKERGVLLWQVAEKLGIADCSLSRLLRYPISEEKHSRILGIIDELAES